MHSSTGRKLESFLCGRQKQIGKLKSPQFKQNLIFHNVLKLGTRMLKANFLKNDFLFLKKKKKTFSAHNCFMENSVPLIIPYLPYPTRYSHLV